MLEPVLEVAEDMIISRLPMQRIGEAEDVGGTAVFLASPAAAFMNGATIALDGGFPVGMPSMFKL